MSSASETKNAKVPVNIKNNRFSQYFPGSLSGSLPSPGVISEESDDALLNGVPYPLESFLEDDNGSNGSR